VLIAPAPDFTEQLMWNAFSDEVREEIRTKGVWMRPSEYGDGAAYPITRALIEEGRNHLLLGSAIEVGCPVRILQGAQDPDVPWQHAFRAGAPAAGRGRGADHDPGRRPPPVASAGYCEDHGGGGGDGVRSSAALGVIIRESSDPVRRGLSINNHLSEYTGCPAHCAICAQGA
jgi:hypothetical protein